MAAPGVFVHLCHGLNDFYPHRVEMDVTNEGKKVIIFVAQDGFIPVFKEMSFSAVPAVEVLGVPGKELSHDR